SASANLKISAIGSCCSRSRPSGWQRRPSSRCCSSSKAMVHSGRWLIGCILGSNSTTCCGIRSMSNKIGNFTRRMTTVSTAGITRTPTYSPGVDGVRAGETNLCHVDDGDGGLRYLGYAVSELAEKARFEEVAYLLLFGKLPTQEELKDFTTQLAAHSVLPGPVDTFLGMVPPAARPMDILRTSVSLLGLTDPDASDSSHNANVRKAIRLLAQIPLIIAMAHRRATGTPRVEPQADLSFAENLLLFFTGRRGDETAKAMAHVLDVSLTLYAEHEFNASTFSARVTASTMTDLHSAITAAI